MKSPNTDTWNRILVRFLLAFAFWEAVAIPLRMLFFSKFYFDPSLKGIFVPIADVYWVGPIAGDLLQTLFLGILYGYAKENLPKGLVGGLLFGLLFSLTAYVGLVLFLSNLIQITPTILWWVWAGYQTLFALATGAIYSIGWDSSDNQ
ncbi:hypothetical protein [Leptospira ilyithenensis]|uniref:Uncharacterized protein n=1 Tax=Leptospira ilyithenensis TaxID=2484901 RepID=A0A4R9LNU3_9LEPT|nr:hypothetical protein [Leptospira ilyithenensis]TGN06901.1 hypothetical protein EHS11_17335 [Leptospira ilyithenensis]